MSVTRTEWDKLEQWMTTSRLEEIVGPRPEPSYPDMFRGMDTNATVPYSMEAKGAMFPYVEIADNADGSVYIPIDHLDEVIEWLTDVRDAA